MIPTKVCSLNAQKITVLHILVIKKAHLSTVLYLGLEHVQSFETQGKASITVSCQSSTKKTNTHFP